MGFLSKLGNFKMEESRKRVRLSTITNEIESENQPLIFNRQNESIMNASYKKFTQ